MNSRRDFLQYSALGLASAAVLGGCATHPAPSALQEAGPVTLIDCHTHIYDPTRPQGTPPNDFPPPGDPVLYRPTLPDRFLEVAAPHGVSGTVVVEASIWSEDNDWLLDLARDHTAIVGLVGNLVPGTPAFADHVRRLSRNPLFRGIRIRGVGNKTVEQGVEDSAWLRDLNLLADHDLSLDIANWSGTVPQMTRLAAALPSLRMVVNHIAGLRVDGQPPPPQFIEELGRAARHSNIYCKISGLAEATGARNGTAPTDPEYYKPTIDAFWDTLGEDRLIYGSNWPVCEWAASYATVFGIVDAYFTSKGSAARRKFFAGNARHAYKWVPRT